MMAESSRRGVPEATVGRLPGYLRALTELAERGHASVSSDELADLLGIRSAQVRKDLSSLGSYGVRGWATTWPGSPTRSRPSSG